MKPDTVQSVADTVLRLTPGTRFYVAFPLRLSERVTHKVVVENLRAQGYLRVYADKSVMHLDDLDASKIDLTRSAEVLVVVDRLALSDEVGARLNDAIGTAFADGDGECFIILADTLEKLRFTERFECAYDGTRAPAPSPQLFSFNNPRGACERCNGFGAVLEYDESLIICNPDRTLRDGAIDPWTKPRYDNKRRALADFARRERIPMDVPWKELTASQQHMLLKSRSRGYKGIVPFLHDLEEKRYKQYIRIFLRQYQTAQECPDCHGSKLRPEALNVRVDGKTIADVSGLSVGSLCEWVDNLTLSTFEQKVAETILREARERIRFLRDVGLDYLSLNRATLTLSGGEA